jgi:two-component system sensor histidine kinase YesM
MMRDPLSLWFIVKNYRFQSVFIKNFFIILAFILLPVTGLSVGIYNLYSKTVTEEISTAHLSALSRIRDMVDMMIREVDDFSIRVASDATLKDLLDTEMTRSPDYEMNINIAKLNTVLQTSNITRYYVDSIYVYSEKNRYILSSQIGKYAVEDFADLGWMDDYNEKKLQYKNWSVARKARPRPTDSEDRQLITFIRTAPLFLNDKSGSVLINIDTARFMNMINQANNHYIDNIFIVDADGTILGNNNFDFINHPAAEIIPYQELMAGNPNEPKFIYKEGTRQSISYVNSTYNNWKFVSIVPLKLYADKARYIRNYLVTSSLFSIFVAMILSLVVSWRMFIPIKQIMSVVNRPGEWLDHTDGSKSRVNEIKYITSSILSSYGEKQELENELRRRLSLLDQAQTIALQSQINPHFLYNTMETINWQALRLSGGENPVSEMISSLSQLLRFSLEGEENLVSIRAEIVYCQHYIDIQKIRYPRKFEVEWHIDEKIKDCKIPKITLQPLIENAIYHGIKPKQGEGKIIVTGSMEGSNVELRIADNGVGVEQARMDQINNELSQKNWIAGNHIGLKNVNQRIKLIFGAQCGIHFSSEFGKGTELIIRITTLQD